MIKRIVKRFRYGEKGFTLIELLVVVAVLGALAAVAIPNVGRFIGQGETEAEQTELHNIQTAVLALMADQSQGQLDAAYGVPGTGIDDMDTVLCSGVALSVYITGLESDGTTASGCFYSFTIDGDVTQESCP